MIDAQSSTGKKYRAIEQVHEIELSSRCNLRCKYCPHPKMQREKLDMSDEVINRALALVEHFCKKGTQQELALTGLGEALLHTRFAEVVKRARDVIGWSRDLTVSTNGIELTDEILEKIAPLKPIVYVSLHRPEVGGLAIQRALKHGLTVGHNSAFATTPFNWLGKVDWPSTASRILCEYLQQGWCVVRADGRIGTCCQDAENEYGDLGSIFDDFNNLRTRPHAGCESCFMRVPSIYDNMTGGASA